MRQTTLTSASQNCLSCANRRDASYWLSGTTHDATIQEINVFTSFSTRSASGPQMRWRCERERGASRSGSCKSVATGSRTTFGAWAPVPTAGLHCSWRDPSTWWWACSPSSRLAELMCRWIRRTPPNCWPSYCKMQASKFSSPSRS